MWRPRVWKPYLGTAEKGGGTADALLSPDTQQRHGPPRLLDGLGAREVAEILGCTTRKILDRRSSLFKQGSHHDGIYLVESGRIRVFYTAPSGRELTLAYWQPGNFVGGPDVFDYGTHVWSGEASQNSSVLHLPGVALRRLISVIPGLGINVIEGLAFKGRCYSGMAQMLGTTSATERLIHVLLHLAELYGVKESRGTLIAAAFTHSDIANMIGATRQWVTISLTRFTDMGLIGTHHSNLVLIKPDDLTQLKNNRTVKSLKETPAREV